MKMEPNETLPQDKIDISLENSFGVFISNQSAEELAENIRNSRLFNREIEPFD